MKVQNAQQDAVLSLDDDVNMELSLIESGFIIINLHEKVVFIIKDSVNMIKGLIELDSIKISFDPIIRPEFPALNTELRIKSQKGLSVKYDYFFNLESEYEINHLGLLRNQGIIDLYLFDQCVKKHYITSLTDGEKKQLEDCIEIIKVDKKFPI